MRNLPNGRAISALGFGCSAIWAKRRFDESKALQILQAAVGAGINHFDVAPSYGAGCGEERLGKFLVHQSRADLIISTKVGVNLVDGKVVRSFDPDSMRRSFDASLQRLGLDYVDILYLHGPAVAELNDATYRFFMDLKAEKRIVYSGVNSFMPEVLDATVESPIDAVMLQYNMADRSLGKQMQALQKTGKIVLSGTALARGIFDPRSFLPTNWISLWYLLRILRSDPVFWLTGSRLARRLRALGKDPYVAAIEFATSEPAILSNLFSSSRAANVIANAAAGHNALDEAGFAALRDLVQSP